MEKTVNPKRIIRGNDRDEFEIEFLIHRLKFPFVEIFENCFKFKEYLYNDFCNCTPIPCFRLFRREYFSDEEMQRGRKEANDRIPVIDNYHSSIVISAPTFFSTDFEMKVNEIANEFSQLKYDCKVEPIYCLQNIFDTKIAVVLSDVSKCLDVIKQKPFGINQFDVAEYCKDRVYDIMSELNKLPHQDLKISVIESIIANDDNSVKFFFAEKEGIRTWDAAEIWKDMKLEINSLLRREIDMITAANPEPPYVDNEKTRKRPTKKFSEFLICDNKEAVMRHLHNSLDKNSSGPDIAMKLESLVDKGYIRKEARVVNCAIREFHLQCTNQNISNYYLNNYAKSKDKQSFINSLP